MPQLQPSLALPMQVMQRNIRLFSSTELRCLVFMSRSRLIIFSLIHWSCGSSSWLHVRALGSNDGPTWSNRCWQRRSCSLNCSRWQSVTHLEPEHNTYRTNHLLAQDVLHIYGRNEAEVKMNLISFYTIFSTKTDTSGAQSFGNLDLSSLLGPSNIPAAPRGGLTSEDLQRAMSGTSSYQSHFIS
jgi:hypothetical protein